MTELTKIAVELVKMDVESTIGSKVDGRRNWAIRTENHGDVKVAYVGAYGQMRRRNLMSEYIRIIKKYQVRWFEYTYKKDFKAVVKALEDAGYIIYNI